MSVKKQKPRKKRHLRVRKKISGTPDRSRFNVFRSINNIYAQIIDDQSGTTIVSASSLEKELKGKIRTGGNKDSAKMVGLLIARRASEKGIKSVVFDRGGYAYHGRVKALADAAREGGLEF